MRVKLSTVVAFAAGITVAQSAVAADLPARMPTKGPPMVIAQNWSGCYIGGHVGGGWAKDTWTNTVETSTFGDLSPTNSHSQSKAGFVGGGQIGCNYQVNSLVFGIEGTFSGSTIKGDLANTTFGFGDDVFTHKVRAIATAAGRLGYAAGPWMPYVKGGWAGADVSLSVSDTVATPGSGSDQKWHNGWIGGGGIEYMLTRNWIVGFEYNYISLQTKSHEVGGGDGLYTFDVKPRFQTAVARISYKW